MKNDIIEIYSPEFITRLPARLNWREKEPEINNELDLKK